MEYKLTYKSLFSGVFFLLIGVIFLIIENTFYQYLDEDGFLHESLFMPLGVLALIFGILLISLFVAITLAIKILVLVRK